ncbi:eCIS core domain-containing protein [Kribbella sp. CWNU-51]
MLIGPARATAGQNVDGEPDRLRASDRARQPPQSPAMSGLVRTKLRVGGTGDPQETEADRMADQVTRELGPDVTTAPPGSAGGVPPAEPPTGRGSPPAPAAMTGLAAPGQPLPGRLAQILGVRLGRDLSDVRVHTDDDAASAANRLGARAFAAGPHLGFAPGEYDPGSPAGQRLLAHELAHVVQSGPVGDLVRRQPDPNTRESSFDPTPALAPPEPVVYGPEYVQDIDVTSPTLPGQRAEQQTLRVHVVVDEKDRRDIATWIVPISRLRQPPTGPISPGTAVTTIDGAKLTALASTPTHVITAEYTKFAVGAASTSVLKLSDGTVIVIDAGVNTSGMRDSAGKAVTEAAFAEAIVERVAAAIGPDAVIRELLISHAHSDHVNVVPRLLRRFAVDVIRFNDVMRRWATDLRAEMQEAQRTRLAEAEARFTERMAGQRAVWELGQGAGFAPDARDVAWRNYVRQEFLKTPQGKAAIERVLVQVKGGTLDVVDFDLDTGAGRGRPTPYTAEDPYTVTETAREPHAKVPRVTVDETGQPGGTIKDQDIDKYASSFVVSVKGGMTVLVIPDLRAKDLAKVKERFATAMEHVNRTYQLWDATHHLQKGWYNIEGRLAASQLEVLADFLMTFRSPVGADAVVVSAELDLTRAKAATLVDPVVLRFLRSLGYEAYVAASARDIQAVDITTAQGEKMTGILNTKAPGQGDPQLSLRRARLALEKLAAERKTTAASLEGSADPSERATLERRSTDLATQEAELKALVKDTMTELEQRMRTAEPTTASLSEPPPDFPKQRAMDEWLARHDFDLPVVRSMHLTEMALVVLDRAPDLSAAPPGSPGARARELAAVRSRINEIGLRLRDGVPHIEVQAELLVEYERYRILLENELNPPDVAQKPMAGVTRDLLTSDLQAVKERIATLTESPPTTEYARVPRTGELLARHVSVVRPLDPTGGPKPESPTMRGARQVAEGVGRAGGLVMVATTITGESDLLARWGKGKANSAEVAAGTLKNAASATVGVLMLRGMNVHPGVFVVLAVIEVGEAMLRDYETQEQHDIAVIQARASAEVNLGCLAVGSVLMAIPTPVTFIGGLVLTTVGPLLLKALGVDEWIANWAERSGSFNPPEVVEVLQTLRKLLLGYRVVIGSIELARRAQDPADPTFARLPDAKQRAEQLQHDESVKAILLEDKILDEFQTAYRDARTNYAGLKDLDDYRAQFYALRQQAGLSRAGDAFRQLYRRAPTADQMFRALDAEMSIDALTVEEVADMPQWSHLDIELGELSTLIDAATGEEGHAKARDKDRRVQAMIDNARYRLDPAAHSVERAKALISPTSVAGAAYPTRLLDREARLQGLRRRYLERTPALVGQQLTLAGKPPLVNPYPLTPDWAVTATEETIAMYTRAVENGDGPPLDLVRGMALTSQGAEDYRAYVAAHSAYRTFLSWLQTVEQMIDGQLSQADRIVAAEPPDQRPALATRTSNARNAMRAARSLRYAKRGIVYLSELTDLRTSVWKEEIKAISPLFGGDPVKPLSDAEEAALVTQRDVFESDLQVRPPLSRRLSIVRSPAAVDGQGNLANIFRLTGDVPLNLYYATKPTAPATPAMNAVVGVVAAPQFGGANNQYSSIIEVYPLNDAAITLLRGDRGFLVNRWNLSAIKASELPATTPAVGASTAGQTPVAAP